MESWDIRSLAIEPHHPHVLRSDDETRSIAIRLPSGEELQRIASTSARTCSSPTARSRSPKDGSSVTGATGSSRTSNPTSAGRCAR